MSDFQAIFYLSEIISEKTYEISVVTYPSLYLARNFFDMQHLQLSVAL